MSFFRLFDSARVLLFAAALFAAALQIATASCLHAETVTFENLLSGPDTFFKGDTANVNNDPWLAGGVEFSNSVQFPPFWSGWAYSNTTDTVTPGFNNEHSAAPGGGSDGLGGTASGETYALAFGAGATFNLPVGMVLKSVDWTNGVYGFLSMSNGDSFAKKFGGASGNDPDFFRAILTGFSDFDATGAETGSVTLDLADFTSSDNSQDFIINTWQVNEDLTSLGTARSVAVTFESSDVGTFGINTPQYLFIDNLKITAVPEPGAAFALALSSGLALCLRRRRR